MTLKDYFKKKGVSISQFSRLTININPRMPQGLSESYLYKYSGLPKNNMTMETCDTIYMTTQKYYGHGLKPKDYLDFNSII